MVQLAQAVDHPAAVAGVDEHRVGPEALDLLRHLVGQRHVVDAAVDLGRHRVEPLAREDHAAVIPKAGGVDA